MVKCENAAECCVCCVPFCPYETMDPGWDEIDIMYQDDEDEEEDDDEDEDNV